MKFLAITLIFHTPHPLTGELKPTTARLREVVDNAILTEAQHRTTLELFQSEIAPVLRKEIPSRPFPAGGPS